MFKFYQFWYGKLFANFVGYIADGHVSSRSPRQLPQPKPVRGVVSMVELEVERSEDHPNDDDDSSSSDDSSSVCVFTTVLLSWIIAHV